MRLNSVRQVVDFLKWTRKNLSPAAQQATRDYWKVELPNRFNFGNTLMYNYTPNTAKYEAQKLKKWGNKPQLVASGNLKQRVITSMRVNKNGMEIRYPIYGKYQIEAGRDFLKFRNIDIIEMRKRTKILFRKWIGKR